MQCGRLLLRYTAILREAHDGTGIRYTEKLPLLHYLRVVKPPSPPSIGLALVCPDLCRTLERMVRSGGSSTPRGARRIAGIARIA